MFKYSLGLRVELIRKDTEVGNNWFSRAVGVSPHTLHEYFIRYRGLGYHGALRVINKDAGGWRVVLTDNTIIDTADLKTMYKNMRGIIAQEVAYLDELMEV